MLPIGPISQAIQRGIQSALKNPAVRIALVKALTNPAVHEEMKKAAVQSIETISEFASTCRIRLKDGEIEAKTVVQFVQNTYKVGDVSNATVIQGEHIVNNTTIYIHINVQNYHEIMNMLSNIPKIRGQLENNIQNYDDLKLFANDTLNPFLGKLEKILSESAEYDKLKRALNSNVC